MPRFMYSVSPIPQEQPDKSGSAFMDSVLFKGPDNLDPLERKYFFHLMEARLAIPY